MSRRILLTVTGLFPQVITETLWALGQEDLADYPTELHVVTTAEGANRARLLLCSRDPGWLDRLAREHRLPSLQLPPQHIHVLRDARGEALADIRSPEDNRLAADQIAGLIRDFTRHPGSRLHVSLAGGRKTMGFFAGHALSLYGRPGDRLSHVLVSHPFESNAGFFFPTVGEHVLFTPPPESRPIDARDASVTLADLPFVRLRPWLSEDGQNHGSYSDIVAAAQRALAAPEVHIDPGRGQMHCAGLRVHLPPAALAFYLLFAERRRQQLPAIAWNDPQLTEAYLRIYRRLPGTEERLRRVCAGLAEGMSAEIFQERRSRVHGALRQALGSSGAQPYLIHPDGRRPHTRYGLELPPDNIGIAAPGAEEGQP